MLSVKKFQARGKLLRECLNDQSWEKSCYFHNDLGQSISTILVKSCDNSFVGRQSILRSIRISICKELDDLENTNNINEIKNLSHIWQGHPSKD